ncbi:MAG: TolC family protein [Flavipsychrobacter sp.]|nr:TolC family protein [Flavipsychrobacter sp.]
MHFRKAKYISVLAALAVSIGGCKLPSIVARNENRTVPQQYAGGANGNATDVVGWRQFFTDPDLIELIDTALAKNQELNITLQELEIARNEVRARKGEYLPSVGVGLGAGVDKVARYTNIGAMEANTEIAPRREMPEPLTDMGIGLKTSWEVDIWRKLRNARQAVFNRYLATVEGKNFVVTQLVSEIADSYYELLSLDNQLDVLKKNIEIQSNALRIVKLQKEAAKVTELAVKKFEAEVLKTTSMQFMIQQEITETENRINFLLGRFPQHIQRNASSFISMAPLVPSTGLPSQLLTNRPDVMQAEQLLAASKLDVKVAKAQFYPGLGIRANVGYQAFNPAFIVKPESILYNLAGDMMAPLVNRNAIKAAYMNANAKQVQAAYNYERTVLNAYVEVANQMSRINNLTSSYELKSKQVEALNQSIRISNDLFMSARADYMEILMTQRDALEARFELIETKKQQLTTMVNMYRALGGGWK